MSVATKMSAQGYTDVQAAIKYKSGIRPKHNVSANGILGEMQPNSILLRYVDLLLLIRRYT